MKIIIRREPDFLNRHYCMMEFKGKFESNREEDSKNQIVLGNLQEIRENEYRLEVGVMDLIGKAVKLDDNVLYTETLPGGHQNERIILVKGVVTKKIVFDKRPLPDMDRAQYEPRSRKSNQLFKQIDQKKSLIA